MPVRLGYSEKKMVFNHSLESQFVMGSCLSVSPGLLLRGVWTLFPSLNKHQIIWVEKDGREAFAGCFWDNPVTARWKSLHIHTHTHSLFFRQGKTNHPLLFSHWLRRLEERERERSVCVWKIDGVIGKNWQKSNRCVKKKKKQFPSFQSELKIREIKREREKSEWDTAKRNWETGKIEDILRHKNENL